MTSYFLDSSAAVKLYVVEAGSIWLKDLSHPSHQHQLYVARTAIVEIVATLFRRVRTGMYTRREALVATREVHNDMRKTFRVVEVDEEIVREALSVAERFALRGYDCIHLAVARSIQQQHQKANLPQLSFVSSDKELNAAAKAAGFAVMDPNDFD